LICAGGGKDQGPSSLAYQFGLDRDADRLGSVVRTQLDEHVGAVNLDRSRTYLQFLSDLAVGQARGHAVENFALAHGQLFDTPASQSLPHAQAAETFGLAIVLFEYGLQSLGFMGQTR